MADDGERPRARREPEPRAPAWHPALGGYEEVEGGGEQEQQQVVQRELGGHGGLDRSAPREVGAPMEDQFLKNQAVCFCVMPGSRNLRASMALESLL